LRSSRVTIHTSPAASLASTWRHSARSVWAPLAASQYTVTAPAAVSAAPYASTLWPSVETRAEPCIMPTRCAYLSHTGSPRQSARSLSCDTCDFCTRKHSHTGATIALHTPLVPSNRCPCRLAALALPREYPPPSRLYPPATWPWRAVLFSVGVRAPFTGDVPISCTASLGLRPPSRAERARSFPG
jgi:hypothetical protein